MAHIHPDKGHHDLSVTAYIVRTDTPKPLVLLHMHRKQNMLLPVGGHVELTETPWQAIAHELTEESGYLLSQLEILQPKPRLKKMTDATQRPYPISMNTHSISSDHFHIDITYAFIASGPPLTNAAMEESQDLRWLDGDELDALPSSVIFDNTREVYRFILDDALMQWEAVTTSQFVV